MPRAVKLGPGEVRHLVLQGQVGQDPYYHAREHHLRFERIATLLANGFRVEQDTRVDSTGALRHPRGYVAFAQDWRGTVFGIDFNLGTDALGKPFLFVVTAMELGED